MRYLMFGGQQYYAAGGARDLLFASDDLDEIKRVRENIFKMQFITCLDFENSQILVTLGTSRLDNKIDLGNYVSYSSIEWVQVFDTHEMCYIDYDYSATALGSQVLAISANTDDNIMLLSGPWTTARVISIKVEHIEPLIQWAKDFSGLTSLSTVQEAVNVIVTHLDTEEKLAYEQIRSFINQVSIGESNV